DFQAEALLAWKIPLWNPWLLGGVPFVGNPQAWPLHPSSWLTSGLSGEVAAGLVSVLQSLVASVGMAVWLVRRGRGRSAAVVGALVFGFGGALVSKFQFPNMAQAMAWLPWLLVALEAVLERPDPVSGAWWGGAIGIGILCAHPQVTYLQALLIIAWILHRRPSRRAWVWIVAGGVAGVLVAGAWLLPTVEAARGSVRPSLSLARANRFVLPVEEFATAWVAPWFYGTPWGAPSRPFSGNAWEPSAHIGWVAAGCALGAAMFRSRDRDVRFWSLLWVAAVWMALGRVALLYSAAYRFLPGLSVFHDPARFLHLAGFAAATLAAAGADATKFRARRGSMPSVIFAVLVAAELLPFARSFHPVAPAEVVRASKTSLSRSLPDGGRLWFVDDEAAWRWFIDPRGYLPLLGDARVREFLTSGMPNLPMWVRRRDAGGYEPVRPAVVDARWRRMRAQSARRPGRPLPGFEGADWRDTDVAALGLRDAGRGETTWWVSAGSTVAVAWHRSGNRGGRRLSVESMGSVGSRVHLVGTAGTVRISETAAPGWRAFIDDRPVAWRAADGFREVDVPATGRELRWEYDPSAWRIGLFVTFLGTCILGTLSGWGRVRGRVWKQQWPI
ncbi:MAG: hypothetical protein ACKO5K_15045, partial [Armatimonadota bacterium]